MPQTIGNVKQNVQMNQESNNRGLEQIKDWQLQIDQLRLENNRLRDRLAKIISMEVSASFLEKAEHFNQKFIDMDQIIELMRHEVTDLISTSDNVISEQVDVTFIRFKQDIERCEREFINLKRSFLDHLSRLRIEK